MTHSVSWPSGAWASLDCPLKDVQQLARQYGCPNGYHPVERDGKVIGYAPNDDECNYPIADIIPLWQD